MSAVRPLLVVLALVATLFAIGSADAEDEAPSELTFRMFEVGALAAGRTDFIPHMPPVVLPTMVCDEESPLFGAEGEEPILPVGTIDEVIEFIKNAVNPWFWEEREGADIRSMGYRGLMIRATPEIHEQVGRFLQALDREHGVMVTVDLQAVQLTVEEAAAIQSGGDVDALVNGSEAGPAVSLTTLSDNRACVVSGSVRSWIADADVQVAKGAFAPSPIVMTGTLGVIASVRPTASVDGRHVLVALQASLARLAEDRAAATGRTGAIELPTYELLRTQGTVRVRSGEWTLIDGASREQGIGGWAFLVRAVRHEAPVAGELHLGVEFPRMPAPEIASLAIRRFPVRELVSAPGSYIGATWLPVPTNYTPPEPPELSEPSPLVPEEGLVDLLREMGSDEVWEDPATIEVRNRIVIVRNTPGVLEAVDKTLDVLRQAFLGRVETTAEVVEIPAELARHLDTGGLLQSEDQQLLAEALASGQAVRLTGGRVSSMGGARNAAEFGRLVPYVQGYRAEVAEDSAIHDPIVQHLLDGVVLDVRPARSTDGSAVQVALRFLRTRQEGAMRSATAGAGLRIDLPEVEAFRVCCELLVPLGRTVVAATYGEGGRRALLLLTPRAR